MRISKIFWVLLLTTGLTCFALNTSVLMAGQTDPPHQTHLDHLRGPGMGGGGSPCVNCHTAGSPGQGDVDFDTCNICHSPEGAYDGVDGVVNVDGVDVEIGAINNWENMGSSGGATESMIYNLDGTLKDGKQKWCATCHDQPGTGTNLIDDFEGYTVYDLQDEWIANKDASSVTLITIGDLSGGINMRYGVRNGGGLSTGGFYMGVQLNWAENTAAFGRVRRSFSPALDLSDRDAFNLYVKVLNRGWIKKITVRLRNEETVSFSESTFDVTSEDGFENGVWRLVSLPRASFDITGNDHWGSVDQIRIDIVENVPDDQSRSTTVYLDEIGCDVIGPNVVGDNQTYGYYITGHNFRYCTWCHDPNSGHIDGNVYPLMDYINGRYCGEGSSSNAAPNPIYFRFYTDRGIELPVTQPYMTEKFALCYTCHKEDDITQELGPPPLTLEKRAEAMTNFREDSHLGCFSLDEANLHLFHMLGEDLYYPGAFQEGPSWAIACSRCHDPHGQSRPAMTREGWGGDLVYANWDGWFCEIDREDWYNPEVNEGVVQMTEMWCSECHGGLGRIWDQSCEGGNNRITGQTGSSGICASYVRDYNILPHTGGMKIGPDCFTAGCHTVSQNHATHFVNDKGPRLSLNETGCYYCHADGRLQCEDTLLFKNVEVPEGPPQSLGETSVCDSCHGPGGPQAQ